MLSIGRSLQHSFTLSLACSLLCGCSAVWAQAATDPTVSQPEETHAEQWQQASASHDAARAAILANVRRVDREGPFRPDWISLSNWQVPAWYKDAKFGIFIHWGVYSVPAFGSEWYPRQMYIAGSKENLHQVATYGPLTKFGYKDFIPLFKAAKFDPQAWAELFKTAGARYVVPVFEHHDGFQMYDSALSDWTAAKMGPKRDVDGELAVAIRAKGMHLGASSHRIEHDWFMDGGRTIPSDVNDPRYAAFYGPAQKQLQEGKDAQGSNLVQNWTYVSNAYGEDWLARSAEIVDKYHPDLIFFDWWIGQPDVRRYLAEFAAYYYNQSQKHGPVGIINYKWVDMPEQAGLLDIERGQLASIRKDYWQTDTSVSNNSWGYVEHDTFKTPISIIDQLIDVVSKNGNLLLNVGPRSDGTIPEEVQQVLRSIGGWLSINGDGIYGTRPWKTFGEGPTQVAAGSFHDAETKPFTAEDFRFTTKGNDLFAFELGWPDASEIVIHSLSSSGLGTQHVKHVALLGSAAPLTFTQQADGLHIQLPSSKPAGESAYVFRIGLDSAAGVSASR
jgi:alpha-L-fucosidase